MDLKGNEFNKFSSGEIDTIIKNDINAVIPLIISTPLEIITNIVELSISICLMVSIEPRLTILIIIFQIICLLVRIKFNKYIENININQRRSYSSTNNVLNEVINNIRNIRLLNAKDYINSKYNKEMTETQNLFTESILLNEYLTKVLQILDSVLTCFILLVGGSLIAKNTMTMGGLVTIMQYSAKFSTPIMGLVGITTQLSNCKMQIQTVTSILFNIRKSTFVKNNKNRFDIKNIKNIKIKKLSFSYDNNLIFNNVSLKLHRGEINFLTGKSGSGKTTLTKILMGEYNIGNKMVYLDGIDINTIPNNILNKYITWIPQEPILFNDTIYSNIVLGKNYNFQKVEAVCKDCNIYDDIVKLENSFDTIIDEKGYNFSVGQKQRIAIARALLEDAPIIIIDEPTSSLDKKTEFVLKENLLKYIEERIVIIITHSNNFIISSANIYQISDKKIQKI